MATKRFEHEVTVHSEESFHEVVYFCTANGECAPRAAPADMGRALEAMLNDRGREGWELVQISFSAAGVVAFWKREIAP